MSENIGNLKGVHAKPFLLSTNTAFKKYGQGKVALLAFKSGEIEDKNISSLVRPYHESEMAAYTISRDLNYQKINTNVPEITSPV